MGDDGTWVCEIVELGLKGHGTAGGGLRDVDGAFTSITSLCIYFEFVLLFLVLCLLGQQIFSRVIKAADIFPVARMRCISDVSRLC